MEDNSRAGSVYEKNGQMIKERFPETWKDICSADSSDISVLSTGGRFSSLKLKKQGELVDRKSLEELSDLMGRAAREKGAVQVMMGAVFLLGNPERWDEFCNNHVVVLYEACPGILKEILSFIDVRRQLSHPNFFLMAGGHFDMAVLSRKNRHKVLAASGYQVREHAPSVSFFKNGYQEAMSRVESFFTKLTSSLRTQAAKGKLTFENRIFNLPQLSHAHHLKVLKGRFLGETAIIVAAGPSLALNVDQLGNIKGRALVIAADASVAALVKVNVVPDYVVSVDFNDFTYEKLAPFRKELENTSLIVIPDSAPSVIKNMGFKEIFYTYTDPGQGALLHPLLGSGTDMIDDCQAVIHLALGTAQVMGCDPIVFCGLDLAFAGRMDHVPGTILHWGNNRSFEGEVTVEGTCGGKVISHPGFIAQKEICEQMIRNDSGRSYLDATEGGAKIRGARTVVLKDVVAGVSGKNVLNENRFEFGTFPELDQLVSRLEAYYKELERASLRLADYDKLRKKVDKAFDTLGESGFRRHALSSPVAAALGKMDKEVTYFNNIPMMSGLQVLFSEYYREYVALEEGVALQSGNNFLNGYRQQVFVQEVRRKVVAFAMERVKGQLGIMKGLARCEKTAGNPEGDLELGRYLFEMGWLCRAYRCFEPYSGTLEADFYMGCIRIRQGELSEGKSILNGVSREDYSFKLRVDSFYKDVACEWLAAEGPDTFLRIMADRAFAVAPENQEACRRQRMWEGVDRAAFLRERLAAARKLYADSDLLGAIEILDGNCDSSKQIKGEWKGLYARCLLEAGRSSEGLFALEEAVDANPEEAVLWEDLGDVFFHGKDFAFAITAYEKCLMALPEKCDVLRKLGDVYFASGNGEAAAAAFREVVSRDPENQKARESLLETLKYLGSGNG